MNVDYLKSKLSIMAARLGKTEHQFLSAAIKSGMTGKQIAALTGAAECTVSRRINALGLRQVAEYEPLDMAQVLAVESLGLSLNRSSYLLKTTIASLSQFVARHKITWRGKGRWNGKTERKTTR